MVGKFLSGNYKILVSGDSISKGVIYNEEKEKYTFLDEGYVSIIQNKLRGVVYNAAKFGNTIIKGMNKLQGEITKNEPDIIFIEYGGNDCDYNWDEIAKNPTTEHNPKTDFYDFKRVLSETVGTLKKKGIVPILMTLPPLEADRYFKWVSKSSSNAANNILSWLGSTVKIYSWQERYSSAIVSIAAQTKTRIIDIRSAFLQSPDFSKLICIDGIHPNREGHRLIAEKIYEYIHTNYHFLLKEDSIF
jgi:acyl-CoA thioesterase I